MVGVEMLARGLVLSGGTTRPRALAGVVAAHDAMRAQAGRTAEEKYCDPPAAATPVSRAR